MKSIYVIYDPRLQKVLCAHETANMKCSECKHLEKNSKSVKNKMGYDEIKIPIKLQNEL